MSTIRFFGFLVATGLMGGCVLAEEEEGSVTDYATEEDAWDATTPYVLYASWAKVPGAPCGFGDSCDPFFRLLGDGDRGTFTSQAADDQGSEFDIERPMIDDRTGAPMVVTTADLLGKWIVQVWDEDIKHHDELVSCSFELAPASKWLKEINDWGGFQILSTSQSCTDDADLWFALRSVEPVSFSVEETSCSYEYLIVDGMGSETKHERVAAGTRFDIQAHVFDTLTVFYRGPDGGLRWADTRLKPGTSRVGINEYCLPWAY